MSKYIIDVGDAYVEYDVRGESDMLCLPVRINEFEDNWLNTNIPLTPYTEPDTEKVREEAYENGYKTAKVQCNIQAEKDLREVGERHYQKGLSDAWAAARKIALMDTETSENVTGYFGLFRIMENLTPMQAIEKIRQYEQKEQKSITAEDVMRQYLDNFCQGRNCTGCPLHTPDFTCGRGKYFLYDSMSNEEVRRAYAIVLAKMKEES